MISTLTLMVEIVAACVIVIVSLTPAELLSGMGLFGVDSGFSVAGGVTASDSRQRNVIVAPAAEI